MQQMIEVHPSQLRWAMHNLSQRGVPIQGYSPLPNGMCVIVVLVPDDAPATNWQEPPPSARPRSAPSVVPFNVKIAAVVVVLAMVGYGAYVLAGGRAAIPDVVPDGYRVLWGNIMDVIGGALVIFLAMLVFWLARSFAPTLMAKLRRRP